MKGKAVSGMMLALLLIDMLILGFIFQPLEVEPATIIVPDDYPTIQEAINNADDGDSIFVRAGTYYENVVVNKTNLTLVGENREITIIDGGGVGDVLKVTSDNVIITEFTIRNGDRGIALDQVKSCEVSGNKVISNTYGVEFHLSNDTSILKNNITNNDDGVYLVESKYNDVSGNNITDNKFGVNLYDSCNNTFYGNNIANKKRGIWLDWLSNDNIISENIVTNNDQGIRLDHYSSNNRIFGNNIKNNNVGIWPAYRDNLIYHNNFVNNLEYHVYPPPPRSVNFWDNGYPSGGNYWDDYAGVDLYRGPRQNETGCDGIGDTPYTIDKNNKDNYPLMKQYPDITPPTIAVLSPENITYRTTSIPLEFTVNECAPWMGYSLDGKVNVTITGSTALTDLSEGMHSVRIYANDSAGNMGASNIVYFTVDTRPPEIVIVSPEDRTYLGDVSLEFTVNETVSWIGYSLDGQANLTITENLTLTGLTCDTHFITVYANDTVGNMGSSDTVYFTKAIYGVSYSTHEPNVTIIVGIPATFSVGRIHNTGCRIDINVTCWWVQEEGNTTLPVAVIPETMIIPPEPCGGDNCSSRLVYITVNATNVGFFNGTVDFEAPPHNYTYDDCPAIICGSLPVRGITVVKPSDIAVINVTTSRTVVGQGYNVSIFVTVENEGDRIELFNVTVYANSAIVDKSEVSLMGGNSAVVTFTWHTADVAKGNYTISGCADIVPGEIDPADNNFTDGWVVVTIVGDINGDYVVDIVDLVKVIKHYGYYLGHPDWNPNADINCDGVVDIVDLVKVIKHYGTAAP